MYRSHINNRVFNWLPQSRIFRVFILFIFLMPLQTCQQGVQDEVVVTDEFSILNTSSLGLGHGYEFEGNGKDRSDINLTKTYTYTSLDSLEMPIITAGLVDALHEQLKVLKRRKQKKHQKLGNLPVSLDQLEVTIKELIAWQHTKPIGLPQTIDAYQIQGEDKKGNVHFTGYFTPIIKVKKNKDARFKYPLYTRPKDWEGDFPTRQEIEEGGAFNGMGLELAYADNKLDIYFMQVQGSGYVEYPDGSQSLFSYDGTNKHPYRSIGQYLVSREDIPAKNISLLGIKRFFRQNPDLVDEVLFVNQSYTFFTPKNNRPKGAGHVPLTADYSIAVDRRYIPLGSCLLAYVPVISTDGELKRHEYRFLLAQDIGGAIKGPGHIDLYSGIGKIGQEKASALHHYGKLWLLLPKED